MSILLSVGAAAERLGVHVTTVRRWVASGALPEARTAGGHRRIPVAAVERLCAERAATAHAPHAVPADPDGEAWAEHAVVHTRYAVRASPDAAWNQAFAGAARVQRRETGRQLVGLLLRHVRGDGDGEALAAETRRLAWGYALDMKDAGLPLTEALRATFFFRDVLTESAAFHPRFESGPPEGQIALARRTSEFMNEVQLAIAGAYETDGPPAHV